MSNASAVSSAGMNNPSRAPNPSVPPRLRPLGGPILVTAALALVALLVVFSWLLDTAGFRPKLAELMLQLGLVAIAGALIKKIASDISQNRLVVEQAHARARLVAAQDHEKRLEFLRRMRSAHVKIAHARTLIKTHDTGKTYGEQLRNLMLVKPEIEEIAEDLIVAKNLFGEDTSAIIEGINRIIAYLDEGVAEYQRCYDYVNQDSKAGKPLADTISAHDMPWIDQLTALPDFPDQYNDALTISKGAMRKQVFGDTHGQHRRG